MTIMATMSCLMSESVKLHRLLHLVLPPFHTAGEGGEMLGQLLFELCNRTPVATEVGITQQLRSSRDERLAVLQVNLHTAPHNTLAVDTVERRLQSYQAGCADNSRGTFHSYSSVRI